MSSGQSPRQQILDVDTRSDQAQALEQGSSAVRAHVHEVPQASETVPGAAYNGEDLPVAESPPEPTIAEAMATDEHATMAAHVPADEAGGGAGQVAVPMQEDAPGPNGDRMPAQGSSVTTNGHDAVLDVEQQRPPSVKPTTACKVQSPVTLSWAIDKYEVPVSMPRKHPFAKSEKGLKRILTDVHGSVHPGELLAIMGPTGAGKTSLLNILADQVDSRYVTGSVRVNGWPLTSRMKRVKGYVTQEDHLMGTLSVEETLLMNALLRLPSSMSREQKQKRVDEAINDLGLRDVRNTMIGTVFQRGISGGEKKRTAIGAELVTNPSLLLLDEPTSGLDAFTSLSVIQALLSLAQSGRTVVTTIHQPRSSIYAAFDKLLLLSEGRAVYFGPARDAVAYFSRLSHSCPVNFNPADYFLDITSVDKRQGREGGEERVKGLITAYDGSEMARRMVRESTGVEKGEDPAKNYEFTGYTTGFATQFSLLAWRAYLNQRRDRALFAIRVFSTLFFAILLGLIYYQTPKTQAGVSSTIGALFFITLNQSFPALIGVINAFPQERKLLMREHNAGMYRVSAYFLSKTLSEVPMQILFTTLFCLFVYPMIGFNPDIGRFFAFVAMVSLTGFGAGSLGLLVSASVSSGDAGNQVAPLIMVFLVLFSGFYQNLGNVQDYLVWVPYISFMRWGFQGLVQIEVSGQSYHCEDDELVPPDVGQCRLTTGDDVLASLEFDGEPLWAAFVAQVVLIFVFRTCAYAVLNRVVRKK